MSRCPHLIGHVVYIRLHTPVFFPSLAAKPSVNELLSASTQYPLQSGAYMFTLRKRSIAGQCVFQWISASLTLSLYLSLSVFLSLSGLPFSVPARQPGSQAARSAVIQVSIRRPSMSEDVGICGNLPLGATVSAVVDGDGGWA